MFLLFLFVMPEMLGTLAIMLGAYTWKRERGNRGLYVLLIGIACMLMGLYFTTYFISESLIPS